jgi:hypothetical protein
MYFLTGQFYNRFDTFAMWTDLVAVSPDPFATCTDPFTIWPDSFAIWTDPFAPRTDPFVIWTDPCAIWTDPIAICTDPYVIWTIWTDPFEIWIFVQRDNHRSTGRRYFSTGTSCKSIMAYEPLDIF